MNELSWGTQAPVVVMDPEEEINIHVRAFGLFGVHIEQTDTGISAVQARKFLQKVVGTRADYTRNELINFMRAKILEYVPDMLAKSMVDEGIGILKISTHLSDFSEKIYNKLIDQAEGNARKMDIESAARARMREREGYTYQQEKSFGVMEAAAANEGGSANFLGAGMGLGMGVGVGSAVGAGFGNLAQSTIGSVNMAQPQTAATSEGVRCPECGEPVPNGAKFCMACGAKMEKQEVCPACGEPIVKGAKFCLNCGRRLAPGVCPNCGKEVTPGAKFCLECGTKL